MTTAAAEIRPADRRAGSLAALLLNWKAAVTLTAREWVCLLVRS